MMRIWAQAQYIDKYKMERSPMRMFIERKFSYYMPFFVNYISAGFAWMELGFEPNRHFLKLQNQLADAKTKKTIHRLQDYVLSPPKGWFGSINKEVFTKLYMKGEEFFFQTKVKQYTKLFVLLLLKQIAYIHSMNFIPFIQN